VASPIQTQQIEKMKAFKDNFSKFVLTREKSRLLKRKQKTKPVKNILRKNKREALFISIVYSFNLFE
jgi:hypothetical protein